MRKPAYMALSMTDLRERAVAAFEDCRACPRDCRVNRLEKRWSACKTGRYAVVSSHFAQFGVEDCLRRWRGSGTIFFSHCNLPWVFCQNFDVSQDIKPNAEPGVPPSQLAAMMLELQHEGCHNINFVTPEHVVPEIVEALPDAIERGLRLPIVYNTNAYDSLESLALLDGIVDIYMPDFTYWTAAHSRRYMKAEDYPDAARATIRTMHEQVGSAARWRPVGDARAADPSPRDADDLEETRAILTWIAQELGAGTYVNLMNRYHPAGRVSREQFPEINRLLSAAEFDEARRLAIGLGLRLDEQQLRSRRCLYAFSSETGA